MKNVLIVFSLLCIALIPALVGIFHPGFFVTDDGNWMIVRLSAFYEALRQGQFPVRFLPRLNNGYGYPVADFLYPLFLYLGSAIHLLHVNFTNTIKILFGLSLFGSAFGSYLWLKKHFASIASFTGALVYTLFPYHLWDITKRGSLGEVLALAIVPFIFWQIDSGIFLGTGLGVGLLILSHNTLALLFLVVICGYLLLQRRVVHMIFALLIGLGLSAFFWIPAIFDIRFTVFAKTAVADYAQYFRSTNTYILLGIVSFFIILFSLLLVFKKASHTFVFFLIVTLVSITLTFPASSLIWNVLHLGTLVQFPFRFLSITTLGVAYLTSYTIMYGKRGASVLLASVVIALLYCSSSAFFFAKTYAMYPDSFYSTNQDTTTVQHEYMPVWVVKTPPLSIPKVSASSNIDVEQVTGKGTSVTIAAHAKGSGNLSVAMVYFPGWQAKENGKSLLVAPSHPYGFLQVPLTKGMHTVSMYFTETPLRLGADIISLLSFVILSVLYIVRRRSYAKAQR